jgi:hypothetical protein
MGRELRAVWFLTRHLSFSAEFAHLFASGAYAEGGEQTQIFRHLDDVHVLT